MKGDRGKRKWGRTLLQKVYVPIVHLQFKPPHGICHGTYQDQDQEHGCDPFDHDGKQFLADEFAIASSNFLGDRFWTDEEADEDAGEESYDRHHDAVAYEIHDIQDGHACPGNEGKRAESQRGRNSHYKSQDCNKDAGGFPAPVEFIPENGYNGFHQGDGRSQRRKNDQQEEGCTYSVSKLHAVKHFRQYDEHQAWTALQDLRISAGKDEDRRDNHKAGQKSDRGIKNLDLPDRAFQICVLSHIRTISYHDTHGQRHRVEELSHGSQDCFDRNIRHLRFYIISKTIHSAVKCQAVDRDADSKKDKDRHHEFADLLNTLLHAKKDDDSSYAKKDQKPSKRLECAADETCKIVVSGCGRCSAGKEYEKVFDDPSADDRIIGKDNNRNKCGQDPQEAETRVQGFKGADSAKTCFASDGNFCDHQRKAEGDCQDQINQKECAASVLRRQIWKTPDISKADGRTGCREDKAKLAGKTASVIHL